MLVGLIGAFGLASIQSGLIPYVVALFPLLAACLARYVGHSEKVLDQVKAYLYAREEEAGIAGYERWNKARKRASAGGHLRAFRDVVVLIDLLAIVSVAFRLIVDHWFLAATVFVLVELIVIVCTCYWLRDR